MKKSKKFIISILIFIMAVTYLPLINGSANVYAGTGGKSADAAISWVQSKVGQALDYDGVYGAQCVDLTKAYYVALGNAAVNGNGCDYTSNALPAGWQRIQGAQPQKGDVLIYTQNQYCSSYGHVAIYESANVTYHQNYNNKMYVTREERAYNSVYYGSYWGVIRPDFISDVTPPAVSNLRVCELREGAFTVKAKATDASGIKSVQYAIWTEKADQDDLIWHDAYCTENNDQYWSRVNFSDHKGERGKYIIHMYTYDNAGNRTITHLTYTFKETGPTISDVKVSNVSAKGYTVSCKVTDSLGVLRVQFPTWTTKNDQDDIVADWGTSTKVRGTKNGDIYTFTVKTSEHNNEKGNYNTHIYAYDTIGTATCKAAPTVNVHDHNVTTTAGKAATCTESGYTEKKVCSICGEVLQEQKVIPAIGHSLSEWITVKAATSTEDGLQSRVCSTCGKVVETRIVPKTGSESDQSSVIPSAPAEKVDLPAVTLSSAKAAKKSATVKWKKVSKKNQKKITTIQIQYSMDKTFKTGTKTVTAKKSAVSKKIKKLKSKKTYYFRVRAYKKAGGVVHVSKWSKVKKAKIK